MNMAKDAIARRIDDKDFENGRITLGSMRNVLIAFNCYIKVSGL